MRRTRSSRSLVASVHPDAQPYEGGNGPAGVLLCHGFTGSAKSMIGWARHLEAAGFQVLLPATAWPRYDLARVQPDDVDRLVRLRGRGLHSAEARCEQVFLAGCRWVAHCRSGWPSSMAAPCPAVIGQSVINLRDPRMRALPILRLTLPSLGGITNDIAKSGQVECGYDRLPLRALYSATFCGQTCAAISIASTSRC